MQYQWQQQLFLHPLDKRQYPGLLTWLPPHTYVTFVLAVTWLNSSYITPQGLSCLTVCTGQDFNQMISIFMACPSQDPLDSNWIFVFSLPLTHKCKSGSLTNLSVSFVRFTECSFVSKYIISSNLRLALLCILSRFGYILVNPICTHKTKIGTV